VDEVRVTKDVDVITAGRSRAAFLVGFAEHLRRRGFREGGDGAHRWKIGDLIVDVMPVEEDILGFSNPLPATCRFQAKTPTRSAYPTSSPSSRRTPPTRRSPRPESSR
jgi:hypothetical protein